MISQEKFNQIELEYGCGYWQECCDHACPCAITVQNKGLRQDIWDDMKKEQQEITEQFNDDDFDLIEEYDNDDDEPDDNDDCEGCNRRTCDGCPYEC